MKEERTFKIVSDFTGDVMYCLDEVRTLPLAKAYLNEKFEEELRDLVEMYGADDPVCRDLSKLMYLVVTYPNGFEKKVYYDGSLTPEDCAEI